MRTNLAHLIQSTFSTLLHRRNFERRLTLLAPNQREAMNDRALHPSQRARLAGRTVKIEL